MLKIGIYTPYLHVYGGGERYVAKAAELLSRQHQVQFITTQAVDLQVLQHRLNIDLSNVGIQHLPIPRSVSLTPLSKEFARIRAISQATRDYDIFINQESLTCIPCQSNRLGVLICQIPPARFDRSASLFSNIIKTVLVKPFFDPKLATYQKIFVYSSYVKTWAERFFGKEAAVLAPPVDTQSFAPASTKENTILSVGRFFVGTHNKKQLELIQIFKQLYDRTPQLRNWQYHLAGGIDPDQPAQTYARQCQTEAGDYPIQFHFNTDFSTLKQLYGKAKIFWHGAGMGENLVKHPERAEHFGITTVEAMASGAVPLVIAQGGQPEIVRDGIDGLLWQNEDELRAATLKVLDDENLTRRLSLSAQIRSEDFNTETFRSNLFDLLEL